MIRAYDKTYLEDAMLNLAVALDYGSIACAGGIDEFYDRMLAGNVSAAVSVAPCLKKPETVRTELPMRISVTQSGRRSVLVVLVCFVSVIGSPFAASSVALSVPAFPVRFPFGSCCP